MNDKKIKFAFRMTHVQNIPHVLKYGFVHKDSLHAYKDYVAIGDTSVIETRNQHFLADNKSRLGDYIPFYFGPNQPMLYVIQHGYLNVRQVSASDIVYCVIKLDDIVRNHVECCFTDGHALNFLTKFYCAELLPMVDQYVDSNAIFEKYWNRDDDRDLKRRKEAELLVKDELSSQYMSPLPKLPL